MKNIIEPKDNNRKLSKLQKFFCAVGLAGAICYFLVILIFPINFGLIDYISAIVGAVGLLSISFFLFGERTFIYLTEVIWKKSDE